MIRGKHKDLTGQRFGKLVVREKTRRRKNGAVVWLCQCDCGNTHFVPTATLTSGNTKSCGWKCGWKGNPKTERFFAVHGKRMKDIPVYTAWKSMINRCTHNTGDPRKRYKARGITVCDRWKTFENFWKDMGDRPTPFHEIDRIDNNGNYCKENCKWSTRREQMHNMSRNVRWKDEIASDAAQRLGISPVAIHARIKRGWTLEQAFTVPRRLRTDPRFSG